jgi:hypothetical protein
MPVKQQNYPKTALSRKWVKFVAKERMYPKIALSRNRIPYHGMLSFRRIACQDNRGICE